MLFRSISNYFGAIEKSVAIKYLYSSIINFEEPIILLISQNKLFSPQHVMELMNNNHIRLAIKCLMMDKESYNSTDLDQMIIILEHLDNLPDLGKIDMSKGLLSKGKEKYYCPNGHSNDKEYEFCINESCGLNIKGLTRNDYQIINAFKMKVDSLKYILSES